MRLLASTLGVPLLLLLASRAQAGQIIAAPSGLTGTSQVLDFGAGLYPNFTPITNEFPGVVFTHARYFTTGVSNNLVGGFLTNDFAVGPPDRFKVVFAAPITDLSFVYHQIGGGQPSVYRALLGGVLVDTFSHESDQFQTNNYFGFTDLVFDELQIDFVSDFNIDLLAYNEADGSTSYCTPASANSVSGGGAVLSSAGGFGTAAATFNLTDVPDQPGLLFSGPSTIQLPFGCGERCVGGFVTRGSVIVPSGNQVLGAPFDMSLPNTIHIQFWYRDPANLGGCGDVFNLSNALMP